MHEEIRRYALSLGITEGQLLLLARESVWAELRAIEDLTEEGISELLTAILNVKDSRTWLITCAR